MDFIIFKFMIFSCNMFTNSKNKIHLLASNLPQIVFKQKATKLNTAVM